MVKPNYIRVDGVCLNVDWVKGMTLTQFKKNEQVNRLFKRVSEEKRSDVLSTVYETITGKKGTRGGNDALAPVIQNIVAPDASDGNNSSPMVGE